MAEIALGILISAVGGILAVLILRTQRGIQALIRESPLRSKHFKFRKGRDTFNKMGVEILNGTTGGDTAYIILRSGTFLGDFAQAIRRFREHKNTRLIVVTPNTEVFFSNFGTALCAWITELYENPDCVNTRALLLEPGDVAPGEGRRTGYFFVSDGHNHMDDEGFYLTSHQACSFLQRHIQSLIKAGIKRSVPNGYT
jgi:hypothetical protein